LYSSSPAAQIGTPAGQSSADAEVAFWTGLKAHSIKLKVVQSTSPQAGLQQVVFEAEGHGGPHTEYITEGQLWQQQGGQWKLVASKRSDPTRLEQPTDTSKEIYLPDVDAHAEIKQALAEAAKEHKRVILVFGANWCWDCHVLDLAFRRPE